MRIKIKLVGLANRKKWKNKYLAVILKDLPASFHLLFVYHLSVLIRCIRVKEETAVQLFTQLVFLHLIKI